MRLRWPLQPLRRSRRFPPAQRSPSRQPLPSLQPVLHRVRVPLRSRARLYLPSMSRPCVLRGRVLRQSLRIAGESRTQAHGHLSNSPPFIYLCHCFARAFAPRSPPSPSARPLSLAINRIGGQRLPMLAGAATAASSSLSRFLSRKSAGLEIKLSLRGES